MEFRGRINRVLPTVNGTKQGGEQWQRQDFVFEYFENKTDRWSDKVVLSIMNDRIAEYDLHEGEDVVIGFGHNVREYNGRIFNELRIYKFEKAKHATPTGENVMHGSIGAALDAKVTDTLKVEKADDLPF